MFEINGTYANRKGEYTVIALNPPRMRVRYNDGSEVELKIEMQERIWENIRVEYEAKQAKKVSRQRRPPAISEKHYLKIISIPDETELTFPGWPEKVVLAPSDPEMVLKIGDRLILYALEAQAFFAVATITEEVHSKDPKDYFFTIDAERADFYTIDIDAAVDELELGVSVNTIELESQPRFRRQRLTVEQYLLLNEDDFELLAETLTELVEEAEEEEEEELDEELDDETLDD